MKRDVFSMIWLNFSNKINVSVDYNMMQRVARDGAIGQLFYVKYPLLPKTNYIHVVGEGECFFDT